MHDVRHSAGNHQRRTPSLVTLFGSGMARRGSRFLVRFTQFPHRTTNTILSSSSSRPVHTDSGSHSGNPVQSFRFLYHDQRHLFPIMGTSENPRRRTRTQSQFHRICHRPMAKGMGCRSGLLNVSDFSSRSSVFQCERVIPDGKRSFVPRL